MIPPNLSRKNIQAAIERICNEGIPARRKARDYCLLYETGHYPPKYTIALAHQIATGTLLPSREFSGGSESIGFLQARGFSITECHCGGMPGSSRDDIVLSTVREPHKSQIRHSERCRECKTRVYQFLERIFGACLREHRFGWPTRPSDYSGTSLYLTLQGVLSSLESLRGFNDFIRSGTVSPCDFFMPEPGFIVEFDESQHFTVPRRQALSLYPSELPTGFSVERWISLCDNHQAKDNDPPYRDEQRAWYDTLHDLLPPFHGLGPTVRIYSRDLDWCSLNPDLEADIERFQMLAFGARPQSSEIRRE